jgi:voltage-gated potassium channel
VQRFLGPLFSSPLIRRVGWHLSRVRGAVDRRFFAQLLGGAFVLVLVAAALITVVEKPLTFSSLGASMNWGIQTILGQGDSSYVTSPVGWIVGWFFSLFGVAIVGTLTGALVALVIDFLLKEGQGLGASGYQDHIVVCGWNPTARELIDELKGDEYRARVVVLAPGDKNPAGEGVYFISGDSSDAAALERAGIREAKAALIFPEAPTNEADMHSILTIMAIESMAPDVRTVAEINNPAHVEHFRRTRVDEILVTSRLASRLLARSALYPGLTELVTDIVSGGDGSELYRVTLPEEYLGSTIDDVSRRLRAEHRATLLAVTRGPHTFTNPPRDFVIEPHDDALVLAESLGSQAPW